LPDAAIAIAPAPGGELGLDGGGQRGGTSWLSPRSTSSSTGRCRRSRRARPARLARRPAVDVDRVRAQHPGLEAALRAGSLALAWMLTNRSARSRLARATARAG
jgi:hypothetical protein